MSVPATSLLHLKDETKKQHERETEKPNLPGCSANKRLSRVDLPDPDGPESCLLTYSSTSIRVHGFGKGNERLLDVL